LFLFVLLTSTRGGGIDEGGFIDVNCNCDDDFGVA
jgi:hypothetical protein